MLRTEDLGTPGKFGDFGAEGKFEWYQDTTEWKPEFGSVYVPLPEDLQILSEEESEVLRPDFVIVPGTLKKGLHPFYFDLGKGPLPLNFVSPWEAADYVVPGPVEALVDSSGLMHVKMKRGFLLDFSMNNCVRLRNDRQGVILFMEAGGQNAALVHPQGLVLKKGDKVHAKVPVSNAQGSFEFAQMSERGVLFSKPGSELVYCLDDAGVSTTKGTFHNLLGDFTWNTFLETATLDPIVVESSGCLLQGAVHWRNSEEHADHYMVNGIHISQTDHGFIKIAFGPQNNFRMKFEFNKEVVSIEMPDFKITASAAYNENKQYKPHIFVQRGVQRFHSDGLSRSYRHGIRRAVYDKGNLKLQA